MKGYKSMLSSVFKFRLPEVSSLPVLRDLLRFFSIESPQVVLLFPFRDLDVVLRSLMSSSFEPLSCLFLRELTKKTLFLVALATFKRVGELRALSSVIIFLDRDMSLSYRQNFYGEDGVCLQSCP